MIRVRVRFRVRVGVMFRVNIGFFCLLHSFIIFTLGLGVLVRSDVAARGPHHH
jgi:hypothetical protein